ncbi:hypothetical protein IQ265_28195 [Nodosilinea sp. LEGE 06152]|uniref:hypothetical protein n=1 Tax=Nodosilinea sp. LEGE 06152 TaxID=2777966 RepID=UPI00187F926B|nr:hypothetical protein [Nodosilinea sp. LEGE 06152]MBE9160674.1 hypothetical protein [Nodosilinea sp. LEGE 06152]
MANVSLSAFCKDYSLSKGSVHKFLKAEGFDTAEGLTPDAVKAAKAYFLDTSVETEAAAADITIHTGNHCTSLDVPGFEGMTIDLGQFRDSESLVIDDPLAAAEQFLAAADLIQGALTDDIAAREQRLQATKQAQAKVATKAQELALEQRLYRLQTSQIDQAQTEEAKALADALAQLQSLGKPSTAPSAGESASQ